MDSKTEKNQHQIAEYLEYYNRWRRGEEIPQPDPTELGKVIDEAVKLLKEPRYTIQEIKKTGTDGEICYIDTNHICEILMRKV